MTTNDRKRWEQERKLYEELRGVPLSGEVLVALRGARMKDEPVPGHLTGRVGPEVVAPDDPRWYYFEKEGAYLVGMG